MVTAMIRSMVLALVTGVALAAAPAFAGERLAVVELFTSQGCHSCPPADRVLTDLAARDDVLALSWNVDYWDYLGWKDTFGSPRHTERQRAYNRELGRRSVYTPQIVIGGRLETIGSRKAEVVKAIDKVHAEPHPDLPFALTRSDDVLTVTFEQAALDTKLSVRAVWYATANDVAIRRGENRGKTLHYTNVVRGSRVLDSWRGQPLDCTLTLAEARASGADRIAILLQQGDAGPILDAASLPLDAPAR